MKRAVIESNRPGQTAEAGQRVGDMLRPGDVVALCGDLGSGKTVFVKGLALGVGVAPEVVVTSPTFVILNEYAVSRESLLTNRPGIVHKQAPCTDTGRAAHTGPRPRERRYGSRCCLGGLKLYHFDFYRLGSEEEVKELGYEEFFEGEGVSAVEWADRFPALFGPRTLWVRLQRSGESARLIELEPGPGLAGRWEEIKRALEEDGTRNG